MSILVSDKKQSPDQLTASEIEVIAEFLRLILELEELHEESNENNRNTNNPNKRK